MGPACWPPNLILLFVTHPYLCSATPLCPCLCLPLRLQKLGGYFSLADAAANTGWQEERIREALSSMAREGLLLIDDQPGKRWLCGG